MYKRVRLKDTVEVPPRHLGDVTPERVKRPLQDKLEGRMDEDVGGVVSVVNVSDIGEGTMLPNRPDVYYGADFDAVTYDPDTQEVVGGIVVEVIEFGAFIGIGPVDGLLHVSQISDEYLTYDGENQQLASTESNQTLAVDDEVHARIVTKSIDERNPHDSKIGLTTKQPGLGKHGWPEPKRQQSKASVEGN